MALKNDYTSEDLAPMYKLPWFSRRYRTQRWWFAWQFLRHQYPTGWKWRTAFYSRSLLVEGVLMTEFCGFPFVTEKIGWVALCWWCDSGCGVTFFEDKSTAKRDSSFSSVLVQFLMSCSMSSVKSWGLDVSLHNAMSPYMGTLRSCTASICVTIFSGNWPLSNVFSRFPFRPVWILVARCAFARS